VHNLVCVACFLPCHAKLVSTRDRRAVLGTVLVPGPEESEGPEHVARHIPPLGQIGAKLEPAVSKVRAGVISRNSSPMEGVIIVVIATFVAHQIRRIIKEMVAVRSLSMPLVKAIVWVVFSWGPLSWLWAWPQLTLMHGIVLGLRMLCIA
jgi:hypothetical protein